MELLTKSPNESLAELSTRWMEGMTEAGRNYLHGRGLSESAAQHFRLGVVTDPPPEFARREGWLSIPYLKRGLVVAIKFRCIAPECHPNGPMGGGEQHDGHPKYWGQAGGRQWLFNTDALLSTSEWIEIDEGEMDVIAHWDAGFAAVGVPGVDAWRAHDQWPLVFSGHPRRRMWKDNDRMPPVAEGEKPKLPPGQLLANRICEDLPGTLEVSVEPHKDVSKFYYEEGGSALRELVS